MVTVLKQEGIMRKVMLAVVMMGLMGCNNPTEPSKQLFITPEVATLHIGGRVVFYIQNGQEPYQYEYVVFAKTNPQSTFYDVTNCMGELEWQSFNLFSFLFKPVAREECYGGSTPHGPQVSEFPEGVLRITDKYSGKYAEAKLYFYYH